MTTYALRVAKMALAWQMARDPQFTNGLCVAITNVASYWGAHYLDDPTNNEYLYDVLMAMACGYDWLYDLMSEDERAAVIAAIDRRIDYWKFTGPTGNGWYHTNATTGCTVLPEAEWKHSSPHGIDHAARIFPSALVAYSESASAQWYFEMHADYMIGVTFPWYGDGVADNFRGYHLQNLYNKTVFDDHVYAQMMFPEMRFDLNPFWHTNVEFWLQSTPPGFTANHGQWSISGVARDSVFSQQGERLARFLNNGRARNAYDVAKAQYGSSAFVETPVYHLFMPYYFPLPDAETNTTTGAVFAEAGVAIASSSPANTYEAWTNGVGIVFRARPQGHDWDYSFMDDGSFEIRAYGTTITEGGTKSLNRDQHIGWMHNCLLIGGHPPTQPGRLTGQGVFPRITPPYYSKLTAFTNSEDFAYMAADLSQAYAGTQFGVVINPITNITVQRHILMPRKKYFVFYDALTSVTPTNYAWVYQIMENTVTQDLNNLAFSYAANCQKMWNINTNFADVSVYVKHLASGSGMSFRQYTNALQNPVTGQSLYGVGAAGTAGIVGVNYPVGTVTNGRVINLTLKLPRNDLWIWRFDRVSNGVIQYRGIAGVDYSLSGSNVTILSDNLTDAGSISTIEYATSLRAGAVYVTNLAPATNFHFLSVIYPVKPGESEPTITRIDDTTVAVTNGAGTEGDVIYFGPTPPIDATYSVDVDATNNPASAPATPLFISAVPGNGSVTLSWSGVADSFDVRRGTVSGMLSVVTNIVGNSWTNTGLVNETEYFFDLVASNANGTTASAETNATPSATPTQQVEPPVFAPSSGAAVTFPALISMSCPTPNSTIYYTTNGTTPTTNSPSAESVTIATSTHTLKALAWNNNGDYLPSEVTSGSYVTNTTTPPDPPTNVVFFSVSEGRILIQWDEGATNGGSAVTNYQVWRFVVNEEQTITTDPVKLADTATVEEWLDQSLVFNWTHFYAVGAENAVGLSELLYYAVEVGDGSYPVIRVIRVGRVTAGRVNR